jgi:hypothetical protein
MEQQQPMTDPWLTLCDWHVNEDTVFVDQLTGLPAIRHEVRRWIGYVTENVADSSER